MNEETHELKTADTEADRKRYWRFHRMAPEDFPTPVPGQKPKRVALVGKAEGRLVAPWGEPGWEIWGLNDLVDREGHPRLGAHTRYFQLHPPHYLKVHYPDGIVDLDHNWSEKTSVPLYMDRHYKLYPDSVAYPREEVEALTARGWYHAISFDWMLALAILEGFEEVRLCGITIVTFPIMNGEPISARSAMEYWIGVAEARGIRVELDGMAGDLFRILHVAVYRSELQYGFEREPAHDLEGWDDLR